MTAIFEREFKAYFKSFIGYGFAAFMLFFIGIYTMVINLDAGTSNFEYVLGNAAIILLVIVPVLTMRTIAEERRQKTDRLLYSLPISTFETVLGKYLALLAVFTVPVAVTALYPLILSFYGDISLKTAYCALCGFYLLGAALLALGMFISSLTDNQAIAAAVSFGVLLVGMLAPNLAYYVPSAPTASFIALTVAVLIMGVIVWLFTKNELFATAIAVVLETANVATFIINRNLFEGLFPTIIENISPFEEFYIFVEGIFDVGAAAYLVLFTLVMLFMTVQSLEKRRWN